MTARRPSDAASPCSASPAPPQAAPVAGHPTGRLTPEAFLETVRLRLQDREACVDSPTDAAHQASDPAAELELRALDLAAQAFDAWYRAQILRIAATPAPHWVHVWRRGRIVRVIEGSILPAIGDGCPFPCRRQHTHRRRLTDAAWLSSHGWRDLERGELAEERERARKTTRKTTPNGSAKRAASNTTTTTTATTKRGPRARKGV